jgi:hypothetical protein
MHRPFTLFLAVLATLLFVPGCGVQPDTITPPTVNPLPNIAEWLTHDIDVENPQTRVSDVVVRFQQATGDGIFVMFSYDRNRQDFREAMTCVQHLHAISASWQRAELGDCVSTAPDDPTPLPPIITNGYTQRQDIHGQLYTLTFGLVTQVAAQRVQVWLRDGSHYTVVVVHEGFLLRLPPKSTVTHIAAMDTNDVVIGEVQF